MIKYASFALLASLLYAFNADAAATTQKTERCRFTITLEKTSSLELGEEKLNEFKMFLHLPRKGSSLFQKLKKRKPKILVSRADFKLNEEDHSGYLKNIETNEAYRNKGYASVLLGKIFEEAKKRNIDYIDLHVKTGSKAIKLYERYGFTKIAYQASPYALPEAFKDMIPMRKNLKSK